MGLALSLMETGEERRGLRASGSVWVTGAGTGRGGGQASTGQTDNERTGRAVQGEETRGDRGLLYLLAVLESSPQALAYFLHLSLWLTIRNY
jgi:hypothetical protein